MHNIKNLRKNLDFFKKKFSDRNINFKTEIFEKLDKENRRLINEKEKLEQEKKILSKFKDEDNFKKSKMISANLLEISQEQLTTQKKLNEYLNLLPNLALEDVPVGKDHKTNKLIKKFGKIRNFDFDPKSHDEIGSKNNQIDFKSSTKLSGSRFVVLRDNFALLERALINFMLDIHTLEFGYTEISPPLIVNEDAMFGTGQLPKFEDDQFQIKIEKSDKRKFLIPTAEVVLTNLVREMVLKKDHLPKRFVAATPCFRKEAGSYGKDTKGMIRQHQFYKVEMVSIVENQNCLEELERMTNCATDILDQLELPYRKVILCTGDMGFSAEKTYDIEVWLPSENKYREISSCSSCSTFQANRMKSRYKNDNKETLFVGTLNGSGLAVGRTMIAIMENYQQKDGSIEIPKVLRPYMNNMDKITSN